LPVRGKTFLVGCIRWVNLGDIDLAWLTPLMANIPGQINALMQQLILKYRDHFAFVRRVHVAGDHRGCIALREVWVVRETFAPALILEEEVGGIELSASDETHLNAGGTQLVLTKQDELVLLQAVGDWAPGCFVAFQLNAESPIQH